MRLDMRPNEAPSVDNGWTERPSRQPKVLRAPSPPRSLGAALRQAGFIDAAPEPRPAGRTGSDVGAGDPGEGGAGEAEIHDLVPLISARSRRRLFLVPPAGESVVSPLHQEDSVVSPPPWLRAARRGKRRTRLLNAFGWMMTLIVAGAIIGVAGRYLALVPPSFN